METREGDSHAARSAPPRTPCPGVWHLTAVSPPNFWDECFVLAESPPLARCGRLTPLFENLLEAHAVLGTTGVGWICLR